MRKCLLAACPKTGNLSSEISDSSLMTAPHKTAFLSMFPEGIRPRLALHYSWPLPLWPMWKSIRSPECPSRAISLCLEPWKGGWLDIISLICTFFKPKFFENAAPLLPCFVYCYSSNSLDFITYFAVLSVLSMFFILYPNSFTMIMSGSWSFWVSFSWYLLSSFNVTDYMSDVPFYKSNTGNFIWFNVIY